MTTHKPTVQLSERELGQLHTITRNGTHNSRVVNRARALLLSHRGASKTSIAGVLGVAKSTVQRVRDRYHKDGLDRALGEAPRPGQPRKLDDKAEAHLVALACSDPPEGRERWTLKLLQQRMIDDKHVESISDVCILNYLKNRHLKPWREKNVVRAEAHAGVY